MPDDTLPTDPKVSRFREAYQRLLPEMLALPDSALMQINLDIPAAVTTVLGAWPEIAALREQIVLQLPSFDIAQLDKLELYALAAGHSQAMHLGASTSTASLQALGDQAATSRELLYSDAAALAKRGLIEAQRLKELKGPPGYRNLAFDLLALVQIMREKWGSIAGKTAIEEPEQLDQAETLADQLISALGVREQAAQVTTDPSDNRQRAFTLLVTAYDQVRRAIRYLRWDAGDIDAIAPSLYAGRGGRRRADASGSPATPSPAPVPTAVAAPTQPAPLTSTVAQGMPGADPFAR